MFGEFHESCVERICNDLSRLLNPTWIAVKGIFAPRGGISFHPHSIFIKDPDLKLDPSILTEIYKQETY